MKTVLITGAKGFIGQNLQVTLQLRQDLRLFFYNSDNDLGALDAFLEQADFIFHLAGVNRPKDEKEFQKGNLELTGWICRRLLELGRKTPVLLPSSIQANLDNAYGRSKKGAEDAVLSYGRQSGSAVYVYRLPNVFGKWCRPNYNSAVATFCHNIANDLPIKINDRNVMMNLVYIDDVVQSFTAALDGRLLQEKDFCHVQPEHTMSLGDIAELLGSFQASRDERSIPDMADPFTKKLYSTYLSYLLTNRLSYPLTMHMDDRGSFTEFIKTIDRGQVSINISKPGVTKGNHWHHSKNEKFLVVNGEGIIRFRKIGSKEILEYKVSSKQLEVVDIPTGYTHNIANTGADDMVTVMWCNETFDAENPDTYFEPV